MKFQIFFSILTLTSLALAQKAGVTEIPINENGTTTTISVQKGSSANPGTPRDTQEVLDGTAEISGEPNVLLNGARANWKTACDEWKKEVKDLNKDNQVIALNCGTAKCGTEGHGTVCKSAATYKVKVNLKK